jgi:hypothetical protein
MHNWYYAGNKSERIAQAVAGIEKRCKTHSPEKSETDIRDFVEHQRSVVYDETETNPKKQNRMRPNWVAEQPPLHLKYVLDATWYEWSRAKVRWGDIIQALHARFCKLETVSLE